MIIDGRKVLYTMRNGKIVDPNIPMDGLVCYFDTRGKYNTDIYRNTLLDLSGNGNHGTLQNFSFTESSGYSADGLNFDGVDDIIRLYFTVMSSYSVYVDIDMQVLDNRRKRYLETEGFVLYREPGVNEPYASILKNDGSRAYKPIKQGKGLKFVLTISDNLGKITYSNGEEIDLGDIKTKASYLYVGTGGDLRLRKLGLWNKKLSEQEIQQLMEV